VQSGQAARHDDTVVFQMGHSLDVTTIDFNFRADGNIFIYNIIADRGIISVQEAFQGRQHDNANNKIDSLCFMSISYTCYNIPSKFRLLLSHVQIFDYDKLTVWPYAIYHVDSEENSLALQVMTKIFPALVYFLKAAMYFIVHNLNPVSH
jgi:hypothetical protein